MSMEEQEFLNNCCLFGLRKYCILQYEEVTFLKLVAEFE